MASEKPTNLFSTFVSCHANVTGFQDSRDINGRIARIYNSKKIKTMDELRTKLNVTDRIELTRYELELDKVIDKYMTSLKKIKISVSYLAELGTYGLYFDQVIKKGPSSTELECLSFVHDFVNNIFTKPDRLTETSIIEFILKRNLNLRLLRLSILLSNPWDLHKNGKTSKTYFDKILNLIRNGFMSPENSPFYQTFYGTLSDFPINQDWDFNDDEIDSLFLSMSNLRVFEKKDLCTFSDVYKNLDLKPNISTQQDGTTARKSSVGLSALKKLFGKLDIKDQTITTATVIALFKRILITDITDLPRIRSNWSSSTEFFSIIPLLEEIFKCNLMIDLVVNACGIVIGDDDYATNESSMVRSTRNLNPEKFKLDATKIAHFKDLFEKLYKNETWLKNYFKRGGGKQTISKKPKKQSTTQKHGQKIGFAFDGKKYLKETIAKLISGVKCKSSGDTSPPPYVIGQDNCEHSWSNPIYLINPNIKEASDVSLKRAFFSELKTDPNMTDELSEDIENKLILAISEFNKTISHINSYVSAWNHMLMRFRVFLNILDLSGLVHKKPAALKKLEDRFIFETMALALECGDAEEIKTWTISHAEDDRIRHVLTEGLNIVLTAWEFDKHRKQRQKHGSSQKRTSRSRERTSRSRERTSRSRERTGRIREKASRSRERTSRSRERTSRSRAAAMNPK
jgi:hypothetical protein